MLVENCFRRDKKRLGGEELEEISLSASSLFKDVFNPENIEQNWEKFIFTSPMLLSLEPEKIGKKIVA